MTREEEILQAAKKEAWYIADTSRTKEEAAISGYCLGAKWADENPNNKLVYTKKELLGMGFGFDLNGNISIPQEIEEKTKKYINYRKDKWIKKACEFLKSRISVDAPIETNENGEPLMGSLLDVQMERLKLAEEFIEDFRQAMKGE